MLEKQQNAAKAFSTWKATGPSFQLSLNTSPANTKAFFSHWWGRIRVTRRNNKRMGGRKLGWGGRAGQA